ncbi:kinetochore-associated Ndc80 complex subunit ndc80, partial [Massospora cicadina]
SLLPGYTFAAQDPSEPEGGGEALRVAKSKEILDSLSQFASTENKSNEKDPRNLKDPPFRSACQRRILEFKSSMAIAPEVTAAKFNEKSTGAFIQLFKALYLLYDPAHVFGRHLKDEFFDLLKKIGYPYLGTIPKNIVEVVGSLGNWEKGLGLLDWMVSLLQAAESLKSKESQEMPLYFSDDVANFYQKRKLMEYSQSLVSDVADIEADLNEVFNERTSKIREEISQQELKLKELESETGEIFQKKQQFNQVKKTNAAYLQNNLKLDSRIAKLQEKLVERRKKLENANQIKGQAIDKITQARQQKASLVQEVQAQPFSWDEIKSMQFEETQLKATELEYNQRLHDAQINERESLTRLMRTKDLFAVAKSSFDLGLAEIDAVALYSDLCQRVDFRIPVHHGDHFREVLPEAQWLAIKGAIFAIKTRLSDEKHRLQEAEAMQGLQLDKLQATITLLEQQQTQQQIELNTSLSNEIVALNAKLLDLKSRFISEIKAAEDQVRKLKSNQERIAQLSAERVQEATQELKSVMRFVQLLKSESYDCINSLKDQSQDIIASLEAALLQLNATDDSQ